MLHNNPDSPEDFIDIAAKTGLLNIDSHIVELKLNAHNQIEIQPKGSPFGTKLKLEQDGSITPTITFDTKKLSPRINQTSPKEAIDQALNSLFDDPNTNSTNDKTI